MTAQLIAALSSLLDQSYVLQDSNGIIADGLVTFENRQFKVDGVPFDSALVEWIGNHSITLKN